MVTFSPSNSVLCWRLDIQQIYYVCTKDIPDCSCLLLPVLRKESAKFASCLMLFSTEKIASVIDCLRL